MNQILNVNKEEKVKEKSEPKKQKRPLKINQPLPNLNQKSKIVTSFPIKKIDNSLEERKKKFMKKALKRMSFNQKDKMFAYSQKMNNKKIPFKKIYQKNTNFEKPL